MRKPVLSLDDEAAWKARHEMCAADAAVRRALLWPLQPAAKPQPVLEPITDDWGNA